MSRIGRMTGRALRAVYRAVSAFAMSGAVASFAVSAFAASLLSVSCSVHEWPDEDTPALLEIETVFAQDMPDWREVDYDTRITKTGYTSGDLDIRYTLKFYPELPGGGYSESESAEYTRVLTRSAAQDLGCSFTVTLPEGGWQVRCWTDYVKEGSTDGLFYDADDFAGVSIPEEYVANTDYKDAFRGSGEVTLRRVGTSQAPVKLTLEMQRPLAKFRFIATDFDLLVAKVMKERGTAAGGTGSDSPREGSQSEVPSSAFNPEDYYIRFYYTSFLPSVFSLFKDKPVDSRSEVCFDSELIPLSEKEVLMGFDYVLVNGHESSVSVQVGLYDRETNALLSLTQPLAVPLTRSRVTTVRGDFLTMGVGSGIGVNPSFDDEYNITIP